MWCETRMKLALLIFLLYLAGIQSRSVKRTQNELSTPSKIDDDFEKTLKTKPAKEKRPLTSHAIIAIEIVDPNDNTTKSKSSKRTIESSLGYGYQPHYYSATNSPPKFQFYKYSQQNIPPYQGGAGAEYNHGGRSNSHFTIQKSLAYDLGSTQPEVVYNSPVQYVQPSLNQYYQPGTVLYSTLNQQGHLGGLTSQVPHVQGGVPVIFVRVLSSQLSNAGALYPNIPKSHPYAASLNSVDLQSLLSNHLTNVLNQYDYSNYNQAQNYQQQHQPQQYDAADDLPTHENYPDEAHTRVIFHSNKAKQTRTYLPVPQSYVNMAFGSPKEQYDQNSQDSPVEQYVYPNQESEHQSSHYVFVPTPAQSDDQGYYYPNAVQQDYYSGEVPNQHIANEQESHSESVVPENVINTQTVPAPPYNYHAHRTSRSKPVAPENVPIDTQTVPAQPYHYHAHRTSRSKPVAPENVPIPIDTQTVPTHLQSYNYPAQRTSRSKSRKRNAPRRPTVVKKVKTESDEE